MSDHGFLLGLGRWRTIQKHSGENLLDVSESESMAGSTAASESESKREMDRTSESKSEREVANP